MLAAPNRISILDGCGSLMTSVVQYLVDFDERPDKRIPLDFDGLLHIRESMEETLSTTTTYLNKISLDIIDHSNYSIIINLWSQLFSEVDLSLVRGAENAIECLEKLLLISNDESLMQALVHLIGMAQIEKKVFQLLRNFDSAFVDSIVVYMDRFWKTIANIGSLTQNHAQDRIRWACVAAEILAEEKPQDACRFADPMLQAITCLVKYLQTAPPIPMGDNLAPTLRVLLDSYVTVIEQCRDTNSTNREPHIISAAICILEKN